MKVWVLSDKTGYKACKKDILSKNSNTKVVFRFSLLAFWYFFIVKFVFCTHGLYSFWDISQRDKLINLWHGMPLKRIGSMDPAKHGVNKTKAHYLIATSEIFRELMSKSFNNLDLSRVLLVGQPRNDLLFKRQTSFLKEISKGPTIVLLAFGYQLSVLRLLEKQELMVFQRTILFLFEYSRLARSKYFFIGN